MQQERETKLTVKDSRENEEVLVFIAISAAWLAAIDTQRQCLFQLGGKKAIFTWLLFIAEATVKKIVPLKPRGPFFHLI